MRVGLYCMTCSVTSWCCFGGATGKNYSFSWLIRYFHFLAKIIPLFGTRLMWDEYIISHSRCPVYLYLLCNKFWEVGTAVGFLMLNSPTFIWHCHFYVLVIELRKICSVWHSWSMKRAVEGFYPLNFTPKIHRILNHKLTLMFFMISPAEILEYMYTFLFV